MISDRSAWIQHDHWPLSLDTNKPNAAALQATPSHKFSTEDTGTYETIFSSKYILTANFPLYIDVRNDGNEI